MEECAYMCVCVSIKSCQRAEIECVSRRSEAGCLHGYDNMPITERQKQLIGVEVEKDVESGQLQLVPSVSIWLVASDECLAASGVRQSVTAFGTFKWNQY